FRFLGTARERLQLGKQLPDDAEIHGECEADGRLRREQQFFELSPYALGREVVERNVATERARRLVERETEARGELHGAQDTEAVLSKRRRIDGAQQAAIEVLPAMEGIEIFLGERVPGDR